MVLGGGIFVGCKPCFYEGNYSFCLLLAVVGEQFDVACCESVSYNLQYDTRKSALHFRCFMS